MIRSSARAVNTPLPAVLVPGLACSAGLYDTLIPTFWARGSVTIADTTHDTTIPAIATRLLAGAPPRFVLTGLSMGGYVAPEVVHQAPHRVAALILISTTARPDTDEQSSARRRQIGIVRGGGFDAVVDGAFVGLVDVARHSDEGLFAAWRTMAHEIGPDHFIQQTEAVIQRADSRPRLAAITVPTAVIHGAGDQWIDPAEARELAQGIPGAQLTIIDSGGHLLPREQPEATAAAITALLDRVD